MYISTAYLNLTLIKLIRHALFCVIHQINASEIITLVVSPYFNHTTTPYYRSYKSINVINMKLMVPFIGTIKETNLLEDICIT